VAFLLSEPLYKRSEGNVVLIDASLSISGAQQTVTPKAGGAADVGGRGQGGGRGGRSLLMTCSGPKTLLTPTSKGGNIYARRYKNKQFRNHLAGER
jgi:hypothetical protein